MLSFSCYFKNFRCAQALAEKAVNSPGFWAELGRVEGQLILAKIMKALIEAFDIEPNLLHRVMAAQASTQDYAEMARIMIAKQDQMVVFILKMSQIAEMQAVSGLLGMLWKNTGLQDLFTNMEIGQFIPSHLRNTLSPGLSAALGFHSTVPMYQKIIFSALAIIGLFAIGFFTIGQIFKNKEKKKVIINKKNYLDGDISQVKAIMNHKLDFHEDIEEE